MKFEAIVRKQGGIIKTGRINSIVLTPLIGKRVEVKIKVLE